MKKSFEEKKTPEKTNFPKVHGPIKLVHFIHLIYSKPSLSHVTYVVKQLKLKLLFTDNLLWHSS